MIFFSDGLVKPPQHPTGLAHHNRNGRRNPETCSVLPIGGANGHVVNPTFYSDIGLYNTFVFMFCVLPASVSVFRLETNGDVLPLWHAQVLSLSR